jgi:hypothetical protein
VQDRAVQFHADHEHEHDQPEVGDRGQERPRV